MTSRRRAALELVEVAGFCAFLFFFGLSAFGLVGADEPRYAQIAREMLARRDVVTPFLYGRPWLEKPALYYWRAIEAYLVLDASDFAARLPSATAATLLIIVIYFFARHYRPGSQMNAALITASSAAMIGFARGAGPDTQLAVALAIAMLCWWVWQASGRKAALAMFYFMLALGVLAKGPVALFLAAVILVIYAIVRRDSGVVWRTLWWPGILLFLAVGLPWYVAVQRQNPQFFREFILQHNLERFATNRYHHRQPSWYYLPVLLLGVMPWSACLIAAVVATIRGWRQRLRDAATTAALPVFLVVWIAVVVGFFSFSESKLPGYILPAIPACTLLIADWLHGRERLGVPLIMAQGALSGGMVALALVFPSLLTHRHEALPGSAKAYAAVVGCGIFLAIVGTLWGRRAALLRFTGLVPVVIGLAFLLRMGAPVIDNLMSERPVAQAISELEGSRSEVAVFQASREVEYGLAWYRDRPIPRYERGEMPGGDHLVVVPDRYEDEFLKRVRPRRASHVGSFPPQHLEFYWISPPSHP